MYIYLDLLGRLPLRIWGTLRYHCPLIVSRRGDHRRVPEDGSLFNVSPVSPGFLMRPSGAAGQHPEAGLLLPSALDSFSDSVLGDPIAFSQCAQIPGSDTPLTLPVYTLATLPSGLAYMPGQSSVLASGASPRPEGWSSDTAQIADIAREGPFDSFIQWIRRTAPLVTTGLPGCPYRITSYNGPAISDMNPAFGLQLHHPRFLEFIGAPESARLLYRSPTFWVDRLGGGAVYGGSSQLAEGRWHYVVQSSDSFAVRYVAA